MPATAPFQRATAAADDARAEVAAEAQRRRTAEAQLTALQAERAQLQGEYETLRTTLMHSEVRPINTKETLLLPEPLSGENALRARCSGCRGCCRSVASLW